MEQVIERACGLDVHKKTVFLWRIIAFLHDETRKRRAAGAEAVTQAK